MPVTTDAALTIVNVVKDNIVAVVSYSTHNAGFVGSLILIIGLTLGYIKVMTMK